MAAQSIPVVQETYSGRDFHHLAKSDKDPDLLITPTDSRRYEFLLCQSTVGTYISRQVRVANILRYPPQCSFYTLAGRETGEWLDYALKLEPTPCSVPQYGW
jgi:hypothetical protein